MHVPSAATSVLVVDDDHSSRIIVDTFLSSAGHRVRQAENIREAMALLRAEGPEAFDAVVTDYWMPGGTGVDLIRQAQSLDPTLAVLLITAEGEKGIVAEALRSGSCDYLDKPVSGSRLRASVQRAVARTKEQRGLRAVSAAAHELGRAQATLIEQHATVIRDRIELCYHSHTEASGDFAAAIPAGPDRLLVLASDTAGHDLTAAFQANYFHGLARGMCARGASIPEVFAYFNRLLIEEWNPPDTVQHSLATAGLLLDLKARTLEALNCGFPHPVTSAAAGWGEYLNSAQSSAPLGWFPELPTVTRHPLPDGLLCLWSDGLGELAEILTMDPLSLCHSLLTQGDRSTALLAQARDDVLVLRIGLGPTPKPAALPLLVQDFLGTQCDDIDRLTAVWDRSLRAALPTLSDTRLADVTVCAREAVLNALIHGCGRSASKQARLRAAVSADQRTLRLRVSDDGPGHGFDAVTHEQAAAEELLTEHRGLVMLRHIPDHVEFHRQGAEITMTFAL